MPVDRQIERVVVREECPNGCVINPAWAFCATCHAEFVEVRYVPEADRDRYREVLVVLMEFGRRLMNSEHELERLIGSCVCDGARVVEDA